MTKSILLLNPTAWVNLFVNIHMFCQIHPRALIWSLSTKIISSWIVVFTFFCILIVYIKCICKIELKNWIPPSPPPLHERLFWYYKKTNTHLLNCTIELFNWEKLLENKNVNEQLYLFNKTMLNTFHNFIPNKYIICNGKDSSWFNNQIKTLTEKKNKIKALIVKKNHLFKNYISNVRLVMLACFSQTTNQYLVLWHFGSVKSLKQCN